jgi:hypothetical protein
LLNLLWTRLAMQFDLPSGIFGEDLEQESINPLVAASVVELDGNLRGWTYEVFPMSAKKLAEVPSTRGWEPAVLDMTQHIVLTLLCERGSLALAGDKIVAEILADENLTIDEFVKHMEETGLVYRRHDGTLRLLTDQCQCAVLPDGRFIAAENRDGRLERWIEKYMAERKPAD